MKRIQALAALLLLGAPAARAADPIVPLHEGLGDLHFEIATDSAAAQQYFDQGLRLGYAFWWSEARRSFEEAIRQDPDAPMAYWGKAWAWGPYINYANPPERDLRTAREALDEALERIDSAGERERALIEALDARYADDPAAERGPLDDAWAAAMRPLVERFPDDHDVLTLAAAAHMNTTRWEYWTKEGEPRPGTEWLVETLERVLSETRDHPGANHYYIHTIESSKQPERALAAAQALVTQMPAAPHLVHMGSHIMIQVGLYADAADVNVEAAAVDELHLGRPDQEGIYPLGLYHHNVHFLWSAACFEGREAYALQQAWRLRERVLSSRPHSALVRSGVMQVQTATPIMTMVRFGRWEEALRQPAPDPELLVATGLWRYAQGMAHAALGRYDLAEQERAALEALASEPDLPGMFRVSPFELMRLAERNLAGENALRQGDHETAVRALEEAVAYQDGLAYIEPPRWHYPVRQSLGAALLAAGRAKEAEAVYRADLARWRENGWSLYGLLQSLRLQGRTREADAVEKRFARAWFRSDVVLTGSRF